MTSETITPPTLPASTLGGPAHKPSSVRLEEAAPEPPELTTLWTGYLPLEQAT